MLLESVRNIGHCCATVKNADKNPVLTPYLRLFVRSPPSLLHIQLRHTPGPFEILQRRFIGSSVHLGDHDVIISFELLGKLIVDGFKLLAVSTPRSVDLKHDILVLLEHKFFEILSDDDLDGFVVLLRDGLGLQTSLNLQKESASHGIPFITEPQAKYEDLGIEADTR